MAGPSSGGPSAPELLGTFSALAFRAAEMSFAGQRWTVERLDGDKQTPRCLEEQRQQQQ